MGWRTPSSRAPYGPILTVVNQPTRTVRTFCVILCALSLACSSGSDGSAGSGGAAGGGNPGGSGGQAGSAAGGGGPIGGATAHGGQSGQSGGTAGGASGGAGGQSTGQCPAPAVCELTARACGADGTPQVCATGADGCATWQPAEPCGGHQTCTDGACVCANDSRCGQPATEGDFCSVQDPSSFGHCAADANGCVFVAAADNACGSGQSCQLPGVVPTGTACGCPADGPSVGKGCAAAGAGATFADAAGDAILTCQQLGACMLWKVSLDCASQHLTAGTAQGANVCVCKAAATDTVYVDPAPAPSTLLSGAATGAGQPAACRLASLSAAFARVAANPAVTRVIVQHDDFSVTSAVHLASSGTLAIPPGVHLVAGSALAPTPARYVIDVAGGSSAQPAVTMDDGASLVGVTIDASGASGSANAGMNVTNLVACAPTVAQAASLDHVALIGRTSQVGIAIAGGCMLAVNSASVAGTGVGVSLGGGNAAFTGLTIALRDPGASGSAVGILASAGMGTFADTIVGGAAHFTGVQLSGTGDLTFTASASGLAQIMTSLPANSADLSSGIRIMSGASAAKLTLHGPLQVSGFGTGIMAEDGAVTADGGLTVTGNRGDGIELLGQTAGPSVSLTALSVHDNGAKGLVVRTVVPVTVSGATVSHNGVDGIDLQRTQPASLVQVAQFTLTGSTVSNNVGRGVALTGQGTGTGASAGGKVGATLSGDTFAMNGGAGVYVTEAPDAIDGDDTTELWFSGNDVSGNLTASATSSGLAGGLYFATSDASTHIQLRAFASNRVHGNGRAEIGFDLQQADGTPWNLSATAADPSTLCSDAAGPSYVYCYNNFPGDYAIATASASVHVAVKGMHFQEAPALAGMDFSPTIPTTEINSFCAPQPCQ